MPSAKPARSSPYNIQLETAFLMAAFRQGCLAASPQAVTLLDPFACGSKEVAPGIRFCFNDIPDYHFREVSAILNSLIPSGGRKS